MPPYDVQRLGSTFGAEVSGIDLAAAMTADLARKLVEELATYRLLVVPGQQFDHDAYLRVSRAFGELDTNPHPRFTVPGYPEILIISNIFRDGLPIGLYDGDNEEEWHADHSWKPCMNSASLLYAEIAAPVGGETRFADTTAAYDELAGPLRERIDSMQAVHSMGRLTAQQNNANDGASALKPDQVGHIPDAVHPLVLQHPVTGRRSLLLGSMIISEIVGLEPLASAALLEQLHRHATAARYVYSHKWQVGDLVIWDNRATMHTASPCDSRTNQRLLYRTTIL